MEILNYAFMQRALLAALLVGVTAPAVGTFLVQRRQSLMGDGIGHVALTGVALGFLLRVSPVWMAVLVAALGAVAMELIRSYGKARGDIALAMLFYGGMAGGVMIIYLAPNGSNANLTSYLFGSLTTVSPHDIPPMIGLAVFVLLVVVGLRRHLFAVCQDEEFARVSGLPVRALNLLLAVTAAVTVTVAMRAVGLLLVSALMVIPVAAAQQVTKGFAGTLTLAMTIGTVVSLAGTTFSYYQNVPPGSSIVLASMAVFLLFALLTAPLTARRARRAAPAAGPGNGALDVEVREEAGRTADAREAAAPGAEVRAGERAGARSA